MARLFRIFCALVAVLGLVEATDAGVFKNVVRGLDFAGFNFIGQENPLSGGADFALTRTFNGETLDFGGTELTLSGPIDFTFSTGGRLLPVMDVSLSTRNQPFRYSLISDVGSQALAVDGSFLLNATGSVNTFGFYDFQFDYSVRETITQDGRFADDEETVEFDLGPIDVSGNLFADFLAVLFDPLFQASGTDNIFASFSGRLQAQEELDRRLADARAKAVASFGTNQLTLTRSFAESGQFADAGLLDVSPIRPARSGQSRFVTVPDPTTVMLLMAGVPFLQAARRRRRT